MTKIRISVQIAVVWCVLLAAAAGFAVDLDALQDESYVELTTIGRTSGKPRTVTVWFVRDRDNLYVQSGEKGETNWYRNLLENPDVRLKIGSQHLSGRAVPIEDEAKAQTIHELFRSKYLTARVMGWLGGGFGSGRVVRIESLETVPAPSGNDG